VELYKAGVQAKAVAPGLIATAITSRLYTITDDSVDEAKRTYYTCRITSAGNSQAFRREHSHRRVRQPGIRSTRGRRALLGWRRLTICHWSYHAANGGTAMPV
jgi:hypothetical protein